MTKHKQRSSRMVIHGTLCGVPHMVNKDSKMYQWVEEYQPDKLPYLALSQQLGDFKCEHYWGYLPSSTSFSDAYSEDEEEYVGVFKTTQNGYKWAKETYPYPSEDELAEAVSELHVTGDDLKKDKWTLLAEAYIKAHA